MGKKMDMELHFLSVGNIREIDMKDHIKMVRNKEREFTIMQAVEDLKESINRAIYMERGFTIGQVGIGKKESGRMVNQRER